MSTLPTLTRLQPWRDRRGAVSPLKATTFALLWLPALWVAAQVMTDAYGAKPLEGAIHEFGLWSLRLLLVTLAFTPLRLVSGWAKPMQLRRMLGLAALTYALLHFALYALDQNGNVIRIITEIASRFYLTIGFASLAAMIALGLTSTDAMIRRLGSLRWQKLHSLIYPLTALAIFHAFLQAKINASEGVVMAGVFLALMGVRLLRKWNGLRLPFYLALAPAAALGAATIEYLWYRFATRLPADRIFAANFDWSQHPRPALVVLLIALAIPAAALFNRRTA
ncbi:MAG: sulfite oxidase heme-binding subunit YedZ [Beijerinckiaceae bacterium]